MNAFRRLCSVFLTAAVLLSGSVLPSAAQDQTLSADDAPISAASAQAETTTYSISGRVTDASGNGVTGVTITAEYMPDTASYPIILLPGIMGSSLESKPRTICLHRPRGLVWLEIDWRMHWFVLPSLYLNTTGDGPDDDCDSIISAGLVDDPWPIDVYKGFVDALDDEFTLTSGHNSQS
jgi:hypothetical protein